MKTKKPPPMTAKQIKAEAAFAEKIFNERERLGEAARKAIARHSRSGVTELLGKQPRKTSEAAPAPTRSITIRLSRVEIETAKQQAASKGLKYQTYIKMLLHEALNRTL